MICPNKNLKEWITLEEEFGEKGAYTIYYKNGGNIPTMKEVNSIIEKETGNKKNKELDLSNEKVQQETENTHYQKLQNTEGEYNDVVSPFEKMTKEDQVAFEKTIRDLSARMTDRIGIKHRVINDKSKKFKGKIENNMAYVNLAYATLDTPIHEILGHPIIRAIKNYSTTEGFDWSNGTDAKLYQNLLKELETDKGKEILDRVKRDYQYKEKNTSDIKVEKYKPDGSKFVRKGRAVPDNIVTKYKVKNVYYDTYKEAYESLPEIPYNFEEQQEEAIVELLGLYTAGKIKKGTNLWKLLKQLYSEMKAFMKDVLGKKAVKIDELPDNMTLENIADLLAYRDSKLILPGNKVKYITHDNQTFKTYQEANNHISELAKLGEVDLKNMKIAKSKVITKAEDIPVSEFSFDKSTFAKKANFDTDFSKDSDLNYGMQTFIKNEQGNWEVESAFGNEEVIGNIVNIYNAYIKGKQEFITPGEALTYSTSKEAEIYKFIDENKEYGQSKEIIEEYMRVNNIKYIPEEVYSRGKMFYHKVAAYVKQGIDSELMLQNYLAYLEDYERVEDAEFVINTFIREPDKRVSFESKNVNSSTDLRIKIVPQSEDIKWVGKMDAHSGSTRLENKQVSEYFTELHPSIAGLGATKAPLLVCLEDIVPSLAEASDYQDKRNKKYTGNYPEIGIQLKGTNFRFEYDNNTPYKIKKMADKVNRILDNRYGKLVEPKITNDPKQPIQTKENLKKSINSIKDKVVSGKGIEEKEDPITFKGRVVLKIKNKLENDNNISVKEKKFLTNIGIYNTFSLSNGGILDEIEELFPELNSYETTLIIDHNVDLDELIVERKAYKNIVNTFESTLITVKDKIQKEIYKAKKYKKEKKYSAKLSDKSSIGLHEIPLFASQGGDTVKLWKKLTSLLTAFSRESDKLEEYFEFKGLLDLIGKDYYVDLYNKVTDMHSSKASYSQLLDNENVFKEAVKLSYELLNELKERDDYLDYSKYDNVVKLPEPDYQKQARINTQVAALKKGKRVFPRSLIRSEVVPIDKGFQMNTQHQKVSNTDDISNPVSFSKVNSVSDFAKENKLDKQMTRKRKDNNYSFLHEQGDKLGIKIGEESMPVERVQAAKGENKQTINAFYSSETNSIHFTERFEYLNKDEQSRVFSHEILHGVMTDKINNMTNKQFSAFNKDLKSFKERIKANKDLMKMNSVEEVMEEVEKNPQELVTYAFTNKEFATALNSVVIEGEKGESKSFWTKLKEIIVDVLSDSKTELDVLNDILDIHMDIDNPTILNNQQGNSSPSQAEIDARDEYTPSDMFSKEIDVTPGRSMMDEYEDEQEFEEQYSESIKDIQTGLTSRKEAIKIKIKENDPQSEKLKERVAYLDKKLVELKDEAKIETFIDAANEMFKWIDSDLLGNNILHESNIVQAADNLSVIDKVASDLLEYESVESETKKVDNPELENKLKALRTKVRDSISEVHKAENKILLKVSRRVMNKGLTEEELKTMDPVDMGEAQFLEISNYKDRLTQLIAVLLQNPDKNRMAEYQLDIGQKMRDVLERLGRKELTKKDKELLKQKDENGDWTGSLVSRYSVKWQRKVEKWTEELAKEHYKIDIGRNKSKSYKKIKKIIKERSKNSSYVNPEALINDKEAEIKRLSKKVGKETAVDMVIEAEKKLNEWEIYKKKKRDSIYSQIDSKFTLEKAEKNFDQWEAELEPQTTFDRLKAGTLTNTAGFSHLASAPNKWNKEGSLTEWHDSKYDKIQNSDISELYNFMTDKMETLVKYLPPQVRYKLKNNFVGFIEKSLKEKIKDRKLSGDIFRDGINQTISKREDEKDVLIYDEHGEPIKTPTIKYTEDAMINLSKKEKKLTNSINRARSFIDIYNNGGMDETTEVHTLLSQHNTVLKEAPAELKKIREKKAIYVRDKSDDFIESFQKFAMMAINFKHKSDSEDAIKIARKALERAEVPTGDNKRNKFGKRITTKSNKEQTLAAIDYAINALMYDEKKKDEMLKGTKKGTNKETRDAIKKYNLEVSELRKKKNAGEIKLEEYEREVKELEDTLYEEYNINSVSYGKFLDSLSKYTYLTHIGWNAMSALNNWIFGEMANTIEASSGQFFNTSNFKDAKHLMVHALKKSLTGKDDDTSKKINNLMLNFGIMYDMLDISYGNNKALSEKSKKLGVLNPFELFKRGEYRNQGLVLLSMLKNNKITNRKGEQKSLYEAFDVNGKFKIDEFDNQNGDWDIISQGNKFSKFRNKVGGVVRRNHGNYDASHPILFKKASIGRLLMTFKTWMPQGVYSRFGKQRYVDELGEDIKGRWTTLATLGLADSGTVAAKIISNEWFGNKDSDTSYNVANDIDVQNMRRNLKEMVWALGLGVTALFAHAIMPDDDDEEKSIVREYMANSLLSIVGRVSNDITMYASPSTVNDALTVPLVRDMIQVGDALGSVALELGEEDYGATVSKKIGITIPGVNKIIRASQMD